MPFMAPHGAGVVFTWALTVGVVVYSALAFAAYLIYAAVAKHRADGKRKRQGPTP